MNEKRAAWASAALAAFCLITGQHPEEETGEAICDLISDLLHLAKAKGLNGYGGRARDRALRVRNLAS